MIDIRYHLASIVAIFFALGLGMLTGAQLAHEGTLTQEHHRLVEQIEASVVRMRADNRRLESELAQVRALLTAEREYADDVLGELVAERLGGTNVAVVAGVGSESYRGRVLQALTRAGAEVVLVDGAAAHRGSPDEQSGFVADLAGLIVVLRGAEDGFAEHTWPVGTVSAGPLGWDGVADVGPGTDVQFIAAVDTPTGLLHLIDALQSWAESTPFDAAEDGR